jgi:hypothetical protein
MYTLVRSLPIRTLMTQQAPPLLASLFIAEAFFKLHSFVIEGVLFLATWYATDGVRHWLTIAARHRRQGGSGVL